MVWKSLEDLSEYKMDGPKTCSAAKTGIELTTILP